MAAYGSGVLVGNWNEAAVLEEVTAELGPSLPRSSSSEPACLFAFLQNLRLFALGNVCPSLSFANRTA